MRRLGMVAAAAVLAVLVETTLLAFVPWLPVVPDLILVLAVYLGIHHHGPGGALGAFLLGYLLDTFSGTVLGLNAFAMTAVYAVVYLMTRTLWTQGWVSAMATVFVGGCVRQVAIVLAGTLVETPLPLWQHVVAYGLWEAAVAAVVAPAVFAFLAWEERLLGGA